MDDCLDFDEFFPRPREQVWQALTDRGTLARWLMENDFEPKPGHAFELRDTPTPHWRGTIRCVVLELDPPHRMVWSWDGGQPGEEPSRVRFELTAVNGGTRLRLRHDRIVSTSALPGLKHGLTQGWPRKLRWLRHALDEDHSDRVTLRAAPSRVFAVLTTPEGLRGWWTTAVSAPSPDTLRFDFAEDRQGAREHIIMRIDEVREPSLVRWTCLAHTGLPDWVGTAPRFEVNPRGDVASEMCLVHHGLVPRLECHATSVRCWSVALAGIARLVDEGRRTPVHGSTP